MQLPKKKAPAVLQSLKVFRIAYSMLQEHITALQTLKKIILVPFSSPYTHVWGHQYL